MHQYFDSLSMLILTFNMAGCVGISLVIDQELQHFQILLQTSHHHSIRPSVQTITIISQRSVLQ